MARILNANQKFTGTEPMLDQWPELNYTSRIMKAFNWYAYEYGKKEAKQYIIDYLKKQKIAKDQLEKVKELNDHAFVTTFGWLARIKSNGNELSETHNEELDQFMHNLIHTEYKPAAKSSVKVEEEVVEEKDKAPKVSIQEAMNEKISELLGELEGQLDGYLFEGKDFNLYNYLKGNQVPQPYVKAVIAWLENKLPELNEALEKTDEQLTEGYSNFTPSKLKKYIATLEAGIEDAQKYSSYKKANRKPTVRKAKPPSVQVAKLKYKKEDTEYNIKSVPVTQIIGAQQVWVFNTKNKKLAQYVASGTKGISVKGSKLLDFNPEESKQKTLRKPEETLKKLSDAGKLVLRKVLSELTTKEAEVNGRITEDMIIMKVV